ncbi:sugar transporter [Colletotrichum scovillei]|uniref:Sugar transporter n=1 Tax=Colletotrichum scovillei TaxID=1209932 RepID=A0A9P7QX48_9PEZI|nr:sugar transporter [Colletotrichum scovillei]KAG7046367.1 sugar transporter [Colletotrichum scovillei]KAG7063717.1 sugar transporter [Colletotrichum scovillei]
MTEPMASSTSIADKFRAQVSRRHINTEAIIEAPLVHLNDGELEEDVRQFAEILPGVPFQPILRAAQVSKEIRAYTDEGLQDTLPIELEPEELAAIRAERDKAFSQSGMTVIVVTVALAALLQGHVQASINAGSIYARLLQDKVSSTAYRNDLVWQLGGMNSAPFLAAAILGAPMSLPLNYWMGRRGAIAVAAALIFASSLASGFVHTWQQLLGVRIINGLGMGIKAVSTPILASETAIDQWRGSSILMWQLWVAFGIMLGNAINLILAGSVGALDFPPEAKDSTASLEVRGDLALRLILAAPMVPAIFTLIALAYCMESPRFYMQKNTPNYRPMRAYEILSKVRNTQLQALRDIYLIHKNVEYEEAQDLPETPNDPSVSTENQKQGLTFAKHMSFALSDAYRQYSHLLTTPRLRNAVWSTCIVALAQQLCGINVFAFYSNNFFIKGDPSPRNAMLYSLGFGAVNFLFGLLAIRSIDVFGRRRWLLVTLPLMCILLAAGALAFLLPKGPIQLGIVALFIFLFAAVYSPGLGPIPFTLASESFPLSQREAGCSAAISVNLFFAGILTIVFPAVNEALKLYGTLALFAGLNLVAFALVFLLVEETKQVSLEELSLIYAVPKKNFVRFQLREHLPYLVKRYLTRTWGGGDPPNFYTKVIDGSYSQEMGPMRRDASTDE